MQELLSKRDVLADIAQVLYGEDWITEETFWGSPTELEMAQVEAQLADLGWSPEITKEQEAAAEIIRRHLGL
jgi:ABC-type amino acid transport substrate-binding protein